MTATLNAFTFASIDPKARQVNQEYPIFSFGTMSHPIGAAANVGGEELRQLAARIEMHGDNITVDDQPHAG